MISLLATTTAFGWTCVNGCSSCSGMIAPGSSLSFGFLSNDFSTAERDAILGGISAWNSGPGQELQDATWSFLPDSVFHQRGWWNYMDDVTTISLEGASHFAQSGATEALAFTTPWNANGQSCTRHPSRGWDVFFNDRYTWSTALPSQLDLPNPTPGNPTYYTTPISIGQTARHEFGHVFGLGHVTGSYVTALGPTSGDQGYGYWRTYEDEARALVAYRGNGYSSMNVILSTFTFDSLDPTGPAVVNGWRWDPGLELCPGDLMPGYVDNGNVTASMMGSPAQSGPFDINWSWDSTPCNGQASNIGVRRVNMNNNAPATYGPLTTLRVPVVEDDYWLCAHADPVGELVETRTHDNLVRSARSVSVADNYWCN